MKRVRVRVPASSANLGSGFDCLGLALSLYHTLTVEEHAGSGLEIRFRGQGQDEIPVDESNATYQALAAAFDAVGYRPGRLAIDSVNEIPLSSGLGSSAAAALAGMAAAMMLAEGALERNQLLRLAVGLEGHADNVAAALFGECTVVCQTDGKLEHVRVQVPRSIAATVAVPDFAVATKESREALPDVVPLADAVHNLSHVALLVAALATDHPELLDSAMRDKLHQPHRSHQVLGLDEVCRAAVEAGAYGAALSGSGPSVLAFVRHGDGAPGAAMQADWGTRGVTARVLDLPIDRAGLQVESEQPSQG